MYPNQKKLSQLLLYYTLGGWFRALHAYYQAILVQHPSNKCREATGCSKVNFEKPISVASMALPWSIHTLLALTITTVGIWHQMQKPNSQIETKLLPGNRIVQFMHRTAAQARGQICMFFWTPFQHTSSTKGTVSLSQPNIKSCMCVVTKSSSWKTHKIHLSGQVQRPNHRPQ